MTDLPVLKPRAQSWGLISLILCLLAGILIYWLLSDSKPKPKAKPIQASPLTNGLITAFSMPNSTSPKQRAFITPKLTSLKPKRRMIKFKPNKLLQLRQNAPLQMYTMSSKQAQSQLKTRVTPSPKPKYLDNPDKTIVQGTLIPAVLLTAINSELAGMITARVTTDVYGRGGKRILIPRGTRLIGSYRQASNMTQQRVFMIWQRLIRPDNVSLQLNAPSVDPLGQTGSEALWRNTHFWTRFGQSTLLSVLSYGAANVGENDYRAALSERLQATAGSLLPPKTNRQPTLFVAQGTAVQVMVAQDLVF